MVHPDMQDRVDPLEIVESASIYELTEGAIILDTIFEECTNEETGEIEIPTGYFEARVKIGELTEDKIEAICRTVQNYRTKETRIAEAVEELTDVLDSIPQVRSLREEIERLSGRKRTLSNRGDKVKELLLWYLRTTGQKSVEMGTFRVTRQRNSMPKVDADLAELDKWPMCYLRLQPDKKAVAKAWKKDQKTLARCLNCGAVGEFDQHPTFDQWVYITEVPDNPVDKRNGAYHCCEEPVVFGSITEDLDFGADRHGALLAAIPPGLYSGDMNAGLKNSLTWGRGEIYMDPPTIPDDVVIEEREHIRIK